MRSVPSLALMLALVLSSGVGCAGLGGLTKSEKQQVALYLENAANYYDAGRYDSAYQQWSLALGMDPTRDKARLGQAMALYQLGEQRSREGIQRLMLAEQALAELRHEYLDGMQWRAELGYGLVHARWAELYGEKIRLIEYQVSQGDEGAGEELTELRSKRGHHVNIADESFATVLDGPEREARDRLTCVLGRARMAALREQWEASLRFARRYQQEVLASKAIWEDSITRFPKEADIYRALLKQVERHEAQLRDLIANVLFKLDRTEEAVAELDKSIDLQPKRASSYLNRGILRQELGAWDPARGDLERFLGLAVLPDDDPNVLEAKRRLITINEELDAENRRIQAGAE